MTLRSDLFRGDQRLEAAAVSDSAHIVPGSSGPHVAKIQTALNRLDRANLRADGIYGPATTAAVLAYKQKRRIVNFAYQSRADSIVGKMTIAAMDRELLGLADPLVIIGRPRFGPLLAFGFDAPVEPTAATMTAIVRGNPHVRSNATPSGLPASVPPGQAYEVLITVTPPVSGSEGIDLEVINTGPLTGIAVMRPDRIQQTTTVVVLGSRQTEPGHAGKLQIQASLNGKVLAVSDGFSVCAHPRSVACALKSEINDGEHIGIVVSVTLESDSGATSALDKAMWMELIEEVHRDSPPFAAGGAVLANPVYLPCIGSFSDSHGERPNFFEKKSGKKIINQVYAFKCMRCGALDVPIPNSGYEVVSQVTYKGNEYVHRVSKTGQAVGILLPKAEGQKTSKVVKSTAGVGKIIGPERRVKA